MQPGDENELRGGGFRGMPRPQALKRRNRSVSESYSMDMRQPSSSDRHSAQHQKRIRRFSGGYHRRRAESIGPSCPDICSSHRTRSNSFDSERIQTELGEPSSSNSEQCSSKVSSQITGTKARVNFDLGESSCSSSTRTKSDSPDQTASKMQDRDGSCSSQILKSNKKKPSTSKNNIDKQKKIGETSKINTAKEKIVGQTAEP